MNVYNYSATLISRKIFEKDNKKIEGENKQYF